MRHFFKSWILFIFTGLLSLSLIDIVAYGKEAASDWPAAPEVNAGSAILMDAASGAILYEHNSNKMMYPAGITELVTALTALDCEMTPDDPAFISSMNQTARDAGAVHSHFSNTDGIHMADHYTTAYDMAILTRAGLEIPDFVNTFRTDAQLVEQASLTGLVTGYTENAGTVLAAYASDGDLTLICILLQASADSAVEDIRNLLTYGFQNFVPVNVSKEEHRTFSNAAVIYTLQNESYIALPKNLELADTSITITEDSAANEQPVLQYYYGQHLLGICNLQTANPANSLAQDSTPSAELYTQEETTQSYAFIHFTWTVVKMIGAVICALIVFFCLLALRAFIIRRKRYLSNRKRIQQRQMHARSYY